MSWTRRQVLGGLVASGAVIAAQGCGKAPPAWVVDAEDALRRAATWLWSQQGADGSWASGTYGVMASGQSASAFVLEALLDVPTDRVPFPADAASRAAGFLLSRVDPCGAIGFASDPPDYPVYATALTVSAIARMRPAGWSSAVAPLIAWLRTQQCGEAFAGQPAEGGFPMGAKDPTRADTALHVDLSMSRRALEALVRGEVPAADAAIARGVGFLRRSQTGDGSFLYSVVEKALNKGHPDEVGAPMGYGSATADGVLGLLGCGVVADDAAVQRGIDWLVAHHRVDANPGVQGGPFDAFALAMRNYYRAGAAQVFARAGRGPVDWQAGLVAAIRAEQDADGHLASPLALQKENDPFVATGLAVQALAAALASAAG